jgi:hypothetical protein
MGWTTAFSPSGAYGPTKKFQVLSPFHVLSASDISNEGSLSVKFIPYTGKKIKKNHSY